MIYGGFFRKILAWTGLGGKILAGNRWAGSSSLVNSSYISSLSVVRRRRIVLMCRIMSIRFLKVNNV